MIFNVQDLIDYLREHLVTEAGLAGRAVEAVMDRHPDGVVLRSRHGVLVQAATADLLDARAKLEAVRLCEMMPGELATEVLVALVQPYSKEDGFNPAWKRGPSNTVDDLVWDAVCEPIGRAPSTERPAPTSSEGDQAAGGGSVEVADLGVALRDSENPTGPALHFTRPEWAAFLAGVSAGEFDKP
jgi:hypothetical protein